MPLHFPRIPLFAQAMLLGMACCVSAQTVPPGLEPGLLANVGWGLIDAEVVVPGLSPDCGLLLDGSFRAVEVGGLLYHPIEGGLRLELRTVVRRLDGSLRSPFTSPFPLSRTDGSIVEGVVDQELAFRRYDLRGLLGLRWGSGLFALDAGLTVTRQFSSVQTHRQIALLPEDLLFANNRRELVLGEGELVTGSALAAGVELGAGLDLPAGGGLQLTPEVRLTLPLTSEAATGAWRSFELRGGLALRIGPTPEPEAPPRIESPPAPSPVRAAITTRPATVTVRIEEYDSLEVLPLLTHVYFPQGSAVIPDRYHLLSRSEADSFGAERMTGSALDLYHHLLNILGMRLRSSLGGTLTVTGYRNSRESDPMLAVRRAEGVRRYLIEVWGIAPRRVRVRSGGLPPTPSRENVPEGLEENARVEITSSDPAVTAPWVRSHTLRVATPPQITFYPRVEHDRPLIVWELDVVDPNGRPWRRFVGNGSPPDSIVWNWRGDSGLLPSIPLRLGYAFAVQDTLGLADRTPTVPIDVSYRSTRERALLTAADSSIERYSLVLFTFDSPDISEPDRRLLRAIAAAVAPRSRIRVVGYTDSLGGFQHNRQLALERARAAAAILRPLVPESVVIEVDPSGGPFERFPFSIPEGRALSRTVFIDIRTPLDDGGS